MQKEKNKIYANFKRYTESGNRVAIFGEEIDGGNLKILVLKCSKQDKFDKKLAWQVYYSDNFNLNGVQYHPTLYSISIEDNKPRVSFQKHVKNNFYQLKSNYIKAPILLQSVNIEKKNKMDLRNTNWIITTFLSPPTSINSTTHF